MNSAAVRPWEAKRTDETRRVEEALGASFQRVDAYRYNSASIRVRVIDCQFERLRPEDRDTLVEPHLEQLPERTQADIVNLFTFAPSERKRVPTTFKELLLNLEFEDPSPSML